MNDFKQCIHIEGKCIEDIFFLPCVESVNKIAGTYCFYLENGQCADVGDWLCEDYEGNWHVFAEKHF